MATREVVRLPAGVELRACPLCGGEAVVEESKPLSLHFVVRCGGCGLLLVPLQEQEQAAMVRYVATAWNDRAARLLADKGEKAPLPCPRCGRPVTIVHPEDRVWAVECECGISFYPDPDFETAHDLGAVVGQWNERAGR
jgi:uncharacterized Zn finger protein